MDMISMQEKRDIWLKAFEEHRDLMEGRVRQDIEIYCKGDCTLRFTDENGCVQFRGFYGDYTATIGDTQLPLSLAVNGDNAVTYKL